MLLALPKSHVVLCTIVLVFTTAFNGLTQFIVVNNQYGVNPLNGATGTFGTGVSVCDFDGDGLDDLSFGTKSTPPLLYRNTGNGFVQVPFTHPSPDKPIKSIIWADIDNDGDRDLFLSYEFDSVRLYENIGDLELVDITETSGIAMEFNIRNAGAAFGDYDNDGFIDLYLCKYYNSMAFQGPIYENVLYRNKGDNTFENVTFEAQASVGVNASFNAVWWDYDQDGWLDIFIVNDRVFNQNYLLKNNGNGGFIDVSEQTGVNHFTDAMGCALGDYNNDLLMDFYVANSELQGNYLYQQQPNNTFLEVGEEAGVRMFELCWSGLWMDFDNDGWQDLHVAAEINQVGQMAPNHLYKNLGNGSFVNYTQAAGLSLDHFSTFSTAGGDWNNDGYPDFVCSNAPPHQSLVWQNVGGNGNYLAVTLQGTVSNRDAIGATLYAYSGDLQQIRYVTSSENHIGQNSYRKLFGLGSQTVVDSLVIKWPSGLIEKYENLAVNTTHHCIEGGSFSASVIAEDLFFCENESVELSATVELPVTWSNGEVSQSIVVTEPGSYWYTMNHPSGFQLPSDTVVLVSVPLSTLQFAISHPSCNGIADGAIEVLNGLEDYALNYFINGMEASENSSNLLAGEYELVALDQFGCSFTHHLTLIEPESIQSMTVIEPVSCFGESTQVTGFAFGGVPPYEFNWNGANPQNILAGEYVLSISDANGCAQETPFTVNEPDPLSISINQEDLLLTADVQGGTPPYTYYWVVPGGETSENPAIEATMNGFYILAVNDVNGCLETTVSSVSITGVDESVISQTVVLYPNPAHNVVHIHSASRIIDLNVFDLTGKLMQTEAIVSNEGVLLDVSRIEAGNYVVQLTLQDGNLQRARLNVVH